MLPFAQTNPGSTTTIITVGATAAAALLSVSQGLPGEVVRTIGRVVVVVVTFVIDTIKASIGQSEYFSAVIMNAVVSPIMEWWTAAQASGAALSGIEVERPKHDNIWVVKEVDDRGLLLEASEDEECLGAVFFGTKLEKNTTGTEVLF